MLNGDWIFTSCFYTGGKWLPGMNDKLIYTGNNGKHLPLPSNSKSFILSAIVWIFVFSKKKKRCVKILMLDVMVLAEGGLEVLKSRRYSPLNGISAFIKGAPERSLVLPSCEDTRRRICSPEVGPSPTRLVSWSQTSNF